MLHHRFPNGFTDSFMDETDREVSTLTDRAFRSLCVGDDAVYNDDFFYGYSPFSCHKPLVGEAPRKTHRRDCKKQGQNRNSKSDAQQWRQQQDANLSHMSSFLKALSVTEESCEGLLNKIGGQTDSNGESWDKSALRSIQRELSDFSSYHTDEHCKNHHLLHFGNGSSKQSGKDAGLPSGKSSKTKNGRSTIKLKKLNIKNFFLHSELSPFQTWEDFNQFPFGPQETAILPIENIPKWYDLPFYKELTAAHIKDVQLEEAQAGEPPPPTAPKPIPPPAPPKALPKSLATVAEKRCSSDGVNGNTAPWRGNRSRAKSAIHISQPGIPSQGNTSERAAGESLAMAHTESRRVEVKAVEEVSSLASTPFSICQLMTPLIPSRQPTETSEILSPSALDLPLRPHSEAKVVPEPPVKRDSYKSLAFSILFNLKDNRKRVKSRYSPRKFKTSELPEGGSPQSDDVKNTRAGSEGNASGLSTPAPPKDGEAFCSPTLEPASPSAAGLPKRDADRPLSDDYLLSNLLLSKREAVGTSGSGEENPISPFVHSKKNKSPMSKKQNYPSLNLYRKASPVDDAVKYLHVTQSIGAAEHIDQPRETNGLTPLILNKELSPKALPANTELSPNALKDHPTTICPHATETERLSSNVSAGKTAPNAPEKSKQLLKDKQESGLQPVSKGNNTSGQKAITMDVIRAARQAINAEKRKALSATLSDLSNKSDIEEKETETGGCEMFSSKRENNSNVKKEPPPVPKRKFSKSDIYYALDQQATHTLNSPDKSESSPKESEPVLKQDKLKRVFSAKLNNYIKHQRYAVGDDEQAKDCVEAGLNVSPRREADEDGTLLREEGGSERLTKDFQAGKEPERARHKPGANNTDEEVEVDNDLISREPRNAKKGMLAMRGNTLAKKELFAKKDKELAKPEAFSNVMVNRALINDNYDKAKMALEEIIAERQKRKKEIPDHDANARNEENVSDECCTTRVQQSKEAMEKSTTGGNDKLSECTQKDLKERLEDLRDYNHMRQILAQTEPVFGESHRWGGRIALPGMNKTDKEPSAAAQRAKESLTNAASFESEERQVTRQVSEETDTGGKRSDAPRVPPRNKRGVGRGDVAKETDSLQESVRGSDLDKDGVYENDEATIGSERPRTDGDLSTVEPAQSEATSGQDLWDATSTNAREPTLPSQSQAISRSSPQLRENKSQREAPVESGVSKVQASYKVKRKAPLRPDHANTPSHNVTSNVAAVEDQTKKANKQSQDVNVDAGGICEIPPNVVSPLLCINGISVNQSPPDQSSLSSKSSYFSAESALHRNTETESNVYHSLENLVTEVEDIIEEMRNVSQNTKQETDGAEVELYVLSDHESESEAVKPPATLCPKEADALCVDGGESDRSQGQNNKTPFSPTSTFSPTLAVPSLFKVKDNTFSSKSRKTVQPWPRATGLSGLEKGDEEFHQVEDNPELANETATSGPAPAEGVEPKQMLSDRSLPLLSAPKLQNENPQKAQDRLYLTVPNEDDRLSEVSPASEGLESLTTSTADTADEAGTKAGKQLERDVPEVPGERSASTHSGSESQAGLPKPPAVLPKSEKAVLKAIKLANRRMKKEESQKSSGRSSHSSSKHRADRSENKSSSNEKKSREGRSLHGETNEDSRELLLCEGADVEDGSLDGGTAVRTHGTGKQSQKGKPNAQAPERQGRSGVRRRPDHRHYSCDRVISNVPVYKAHVGDRPTSDRPSDRSHSTDRHLGDRQDESPDPRARRTESSTADEPQQRGRARDKASTETLLRRSHSTEASRPTPVSRQSSHTSQLSRQSSMEHTFVTQSFPLTQRRLLQDPDSGQYFFVDMPVQVKTKTFFDPATGSYVQLPVQPREGAVPQASPMELLTPPLVLYRGFVPVPLSPLAQKASVQATRMEPEEQRRRYQEAHPYLEPVYGQSEHVLGEFLASEELDCPS